MKTCTLCQIEKGLECFSPSRTGRAGRQSRCKACCAAGKRTPEARAAGSVLARRRRQTKGEAIALQRRARRYDLTVSDIERMRADQHGQCAICLVTLLGGKQEHTDHDHLTGKVRGLLCRNCNHMLGGARDNPLILRAAIEYLQRAAEALGKE